jgi:hypothetical protein
VVVVVVVVVCVKDWLRVGLEEDVRVESLNDCQRRKKEKVEIEEREGGLYTS